MKRITAIVSLLMTFATPAFAQVLFNPDLTGSSTPSGYTEVTANGGTITYTGTGTSSGDFSDSTQAAYLTSTVTPNANSIESKFTFTPSYSAAGRGQANINLFSLVTTYGNNTVLSVYLQPFNFGTPSDNIYISQGIGYGGSQSGTSSYSSPGLGSLSGQTLTFDLITTFSDSGGTATDTTIGTLYDGTTLLQTFNAVASGDDGGGGFSPGSNPLTVDFGYNNNLPPPLQQNSSNGDGLIPSGASVNFSSVDVTVAVPEPSTWAMMLGGLGLLAFLQWRTRRV